MTSPRVELFRTDDFIPSGEVPLVRLLRNAFEPAFHRSLEDCKFVLIFWQVDDPTVLTGTPTVTNLRSGYGSVTVRVVEGNHVIYQHPHLVREIVALPLQRLLGEEFPEEKHWGFGIRTPVLEDIPLVRPTPLGDGQVDVALRPGRPRRFHVEMIEEPEPPLGTLAELGVADGTVAEGDRVVVVVDDGTHERLVRGMAFSDEVEEGGFLTGRVYRARERPESYLVHVTGAVPAERTGASLLQFTFTGESFLRMGGRLAAAGNGDQLVGWYHSHLFSATEQLGLSSIDVALHTSTFRAPWQVAGLLNIADGRRVLRFYRSDGRAMHGAPFWVTQP